MNYSTAMQSEQNYWGAQAIYINLCLLQNIMRFGWQSCRRDAQAPDGQTLRYTLNGR